MLAPIDLAATHDLDWPCSARCRGHGECFRIPVARRSGTEPFATWGVASGKATTVVLPEPELS